MAQVSEIKASVRTRPGTGGAREVRRQAGVPAIIYGNGSTPLSVAVPSHELGILINRGRFLSTVIELDIEGAKTRVIPRDVQVDPVNGRPLHIDFQRVDAHSRIRVNVPVRFINDALSPGLKRGGVLNIVRHEVEVLAPADAIPQLFEFSLEGLEIGRSIHISAVKMPEGVEPTIKGRDFTVATIGGHKTDEEAAASAPGAPAAEGAAPAAGAPAAAAGGDKAAAGKDAGGAKGGAAAKPAAAPAKGGKK
jgi:large subunit ribosomal protein L25